MKDEIMKEIRATSETLHDMAEHTGFIKRLLKGDANTKTYGEYIYNLYFVYKAIEDNLEKNKDNKVVEKFAIPKVYRAEEMLKDVKYLLGDDYKNTELLMSTKVFVNRINVVGKEQPELLIAHAYTRYLADLFGGRTIFEIVKKHYNIPDEGLNYYMFPKIDNLRAFVMDYHGKLNEMELCDSLREKFLNEVAISYIYNVSISNELEFIRYGKEDK
ncbi:heme oxygenase (biliverdin-producing) [Clostridium fallax]|uniref:Heme oxygenase n=1 Tax=Clostridium fallax TaxID=1533 RepID=A0A1M4XGE8_9CLOT|nr:biliverdin-producing heme oxygenase [Clostridium fallax]SHE92569.1 Heme oxygenase [Clostridium fallax]SQB06406.1 heme oxygenase [Clostridium fallax]